jgi:hypothetical protein
VCRWTDALIYASGQKFDVACALKGLFTPTLKFLKITGNGMELFQS